MVRVPVPSVKEGSGLIGGGQRTVRGRPAARRTCHRSTGRLVANTLVHNTADFGFVRPGWSGVARGRISQAGRAGDRQPGQPPAGVKQKSRVR